MRLWMVFVMLIGCVRPSKDPVPIEPPNTTIPEPDDDPAWDTLSEDTAPPVSTGDTSVPAQKPCVVRNIQWNGDPYDDTGEIGFRFQACIPGQGSDWEVRLAYFFADRNGRPICGSVETARYSSEYRCPACDRGAYLVWSTLYSIPCEDRVFPSLIGTPLVYWGFDYDGFVWMADTNIPWEPWVAETVMVQWADGVMGITVYD